VHREGDGPGQLIARLGPTGRPGAGAWRPYDVVARTSTEDLETLGKLVDEIQKIPGVTRTLTCPVIEA